MRKRRRPSDPPPLGAPFLRGVVTQPECVIPDKHPFNIPAFRKGIDLRFETNVTLFVGENGSGKSTLLEAIATCCGFGLTGGNRDHSFHAEDQRTALGRALRLSWLPKVTEGFFMRAESFFNFATYLDQVSSLRAYGGKSLHAQSHGESFMSLFVHRFEQGVYILDEPEAALSPARQLSFLRVLHDLEKPGHAQFLISTHSPILLAYPGATLLSLDGDSINKVKYEETEHYQITRDFLACPERFLKHLFTDPPETIEEA
jgi:predicted ATPase